MIYKSNRKDCLKNSLFLFLVLTAVAISSCTREDSNAILTKNEWHMKNASASNSKNSITAPYTLVKFYSNNRYIIWSENIFTTGLWNWNDNKTAVVLKPTYGKVDTIKAFWKIKDLTKDEMVVDVYRSIDNDAKKREVTLTFSGNENQSDKDPYNVTANLWRRCPTKLETDLELKNRVKGYLQFLEMVYKYSVDNNAAELDYSWYPQPLRMQYRNGVRMAYNTELDDWNKCFFDSAQSVHAYQIIGEAMYGIKIKKTDNIADRNLDFVQHMIAHIK